MMENKFKTALEIIRNTDQTDFQNGNNKAIISIHQIEEWIEKFAKQEAVKFALWLNDSNYFRIKSNLWMKLSDLDESYKTTEQLYEQFKEEQDGK